MKTQDVLADHMQARGPAAGEGLVEIRCVAGFQQRGDVAQQRIEPHIEGVAVVAGHRQAPGEFAARDREITQPSLHKVLHLTATVRRPDEIILGNQGFNFFLITA